MADFEKEKMIRDGKLDSEMPGYEELTGWFQRVPATWLPGLLSSCVRQCVKRSIFKPGGIQRIVNGAIATTADGDELR